MVYPVVFKPFGRSRGLQGVKNEFFLIDYYIIFSLFLFLILSHPPFSSPPLSLPFLSSLYALYSPPLLHILQLLLFYLFFFTTIFHLSTLFESQVAAIPYHAACLNYDLLNLNGAPCPFVSQVRLCSKVHCSFIFCFTTSTSTVRIQLQDQCYQQRMFLDFTLLSF